ncbi:hypothetical protein L6452_38567 [Arctium lappa]|uniref:Uncharacterized protein n=1 Tax=Arctium lappa TaxID=4217 RepID=A0ACB8XPX1_ARCLA|nr:hypothetical protein L6452_38567 [Arctium lappa]
MTKLPTGSWNSTDKARKRCHHDVAEEESTGDNNLSNPYVHEGAMDVRNSKNEVGGGNISLSKNVISSRYGGDVRMRVDVVVDIDGGWIKKVAGGNSAEGGDLYGLKDPFEKTLSAAHKRVLCPKMASA